MACPNHLSGFLHGAQAKQTAMEEMTAGQASTMARNEAAIDAAMSELEDVEEALNDSVANSIRGRAAAVDPHPITRKRYVTLAPTASPRRLHYHKCAVACPAGDYRLET